MHGSGTGELNYKPLICYLNTQVSKRQQRKLTLYINAAAIYDVVVLSNQYSIFQSNLTHLLVDSHGSFSQKYLSSDHNLSVVSGFIFLMG